MKTLGVLIETEDEPISKKYYQKNKGSLQFLKEHGIYMNYIPYDYAIFAEIKKQGEKKGINVIPLFGNDFTLEECNECDAIFCVFEGVYSFMNGGYDQYNNYMNILKKTKAKVFPSQKMQEFVINKHQYLAYFKKKGYDIAPTSFINLDKYNLKTIMNFIKKNKLEKVVVKPELGAFKEGFTIVDKPSEKNLSKLFNQLKKKEYKRILLQPFLEEFNKFGEIKTYWVNGEHLYSYKQRWEKGNGVFETQEAIDDDLLEECHKTAKKLFKDIFKDHEKLIQCRVDFACCINNDSRCREFFINEIEICPTIPEQESRGYGYVPLAEAVIKACV